MTDDSHRCIAGPACRNAERIDGQRHGALTADPHTLCDPCTRHIADCARQLPYDYSMLAASLGERSSDTTEFVRSTPTPAMPISAGAEAIMAAICEIADRAAAVVSEALGSEQPDGRRHLPDIDIRRDVAAKLGITPGKRPAAVGTVALRVHDDTRPDPYDKLLADTRLVEPHIDLLTAAPAEPHLVWARPRRCDRHTALIDSAAALIKIMPPGRDKQLAQTEHAAACRAAADCDDCNGWGPNGQARAFTELTGYDIAAQIRDIHHQTRAHLGHTRLRNHFTMPCPAVNAQGIYCGATTVGHDDGSDWVNCTTCGVQWLEDEWDFLSTLIKDWEIEVLRWLLAEAYWRLDTLAAGADAIRDDPRLNEPGSGTFVLEGIDIILNAGEGHKPPNRRQTTPADRKRKKAKR